MELYTLTHTSAVRQWNTHYGDRHQKLKIVYNESELNDQNKLSALIVIVKPV